MLYAVTAAQMRAMEQAAFQKGVSALLLMERAASCAIDTLSGMIGALQRKRVLFVCGPGNNGGDGLAAARILLRSGGYPTVWMSAPPATEEARINAAFLHALGMDIQVITPGEEFPETAYDAAVDSLFGTGLSRAPEGIPAALIQYINRLDAPVLSMDVPSGADATTGQVFDPCVKADATLLLQCHKLGILTGPARAFAGSLIVADIGIPADHLAGYAASDGWPLVAQASDLKHLLPKRVLTAHKGAAGRVLIYAGSLGMAGAAAMAARAALTAGAGLVTMAAEAAIIPILQQLVPNATCMPVEEAVATPPPHDVLLVGPGLTRDTGVWGNLKALYNTSIPTVLDADALNLLSEHQEFRLSMNTVMTPHPGEAARLLSIDISSVTADLPAAARDLQSRYGATVLLKSHGSVIFDGQRMAINGIAAPSLAKGGSGDMLAGILAGLLAQGKPTPDAFTCAQAAALWMSLAANHAAEVMGDLSVLSGDVLNHLGPVLRSLVSEHPQS